MSRKPLQFLPVRVRHRFAKDGHSQSTTVPCPARARPVSLETCGECEHVEAISIGATSFVACKPPITPAADHAPVPRDTRAGAAKRILLIDENPIARMALSELLVEEGYSVRAVPNGPAGVRALAELPADLVLTDRELPGDQARVLTEAVARAPRPPVIVWMAVRHAAAGENLIIKPIVMPELLQTIERALAEGDR